MGALDGKKVIVTGGAGGIGNAAVKALHEAGARVACTFNAARPDLPDGVVSERCDITSKAEIDHAFDRFAQALGGLDGLIHAAGIHGSCPADQLTEEGWDSMMALNGRATMLTNSISAPARSMVAGRQNRFSLCGLWRIAARAGISPRSTS